MFPLISQGLFCIFGFILHVPFILQLAFKYLGWVLFPLLIGYAVYSVTYLEHKGWYSFILSMGYGFLLTFGESKK